MKSNGNIKVLKLLGVEPGEYSITSDNNNDNSNTTRPGSSSNRNSRDVEEGGDISNKSSRSNSEVGSVQDESPTPSPNSTTRSLHRLSFNSSSGSTSI